MTSKAKRPVSIAICDFHFGSTIGSMVDVYGLFITIPFENEARSYPTDHRHPVAASNVPKSQCTRPATWGE